MIRQKPQTVWLTPDGKQSFQGYIETTSDPTGTPPSFGITAAEDIDGPSAWVVGAWSGSYSNGKTLAVTPTIGASAASPSITISAAGEWWIWAKVSLGGEVWTEPVYAIHAPS